MKRSFSILAGATFLLFSASAFAQPPAPPAAKAKTGKPARTSAAPAAGTPAAEPAAAPAAAPTENPDTAPAADKPERRITVAALAGIGINETKIKDDGGNELKEGVGTQGAGVGVRAGYTLPMKVYVGAMFLYHFGSSKEADNVTYSGGSLYLGPEAGYELELGPVVVRPYLGFGYGSAKAKAEVNGKAVVERSEGGLAIWPGAMVRYPIDMFFVGADARYAILTGTDKITNASGFGLSATVGAAF